MDFIKALLKQPISVIALFLGVLLVALPYVQIDKDNHLTTHNRTSIVPVAVGIALLAFGTVAFGLTLWMKYKTDEQTSTGLDLTRVKEDKGEIWTTVSGCEIHIIDGLLQNFSPDTDTVMVLPSNEYFDDECASDTKSSLGAYVKWAFDGQVEAFISLIRAERAGKL